MTTRLESMIVFEVSRWTLYSSVNMRLLVGRAVALELLLGLLAEVAAVDQEEHAAGAAVLDQPVDRGDRRQGLARSGRHLHQGARLVAPERALEVLDRLDLVRAQAAPLERRHRPQPAAERGRAGVVERRRGAGAAGPDARDPGGERLGVDPLGERLGPVDVRQVHRDGARPRLGVEPVDEARLDAGREVEERQRRDRRVEPGGEAGGVLVGLDLDVRSARIRRASPRAPRPPCHRTKSR